MLYCILVVLRPNTMLTILTSETLYTCVYLHPSCEQWLKCDQIMFFKFLFTLSQYLTEWFNEDGGWGLSPQVFVTMCVQGFPKHLIICVSSKSNTETGKTKRSETENPRSWTKITKYEDKKFTKNYLNYSLTELVEKTTISLLKLKGVIRHLCFLTSTTHFEWKKVKVSLATYLAMHRSWFHRANCPERKTMEENHGTLVHIQSSQTQANGTLRNWVHVVMYLTALSLYRNAPMNTGLYGGLAQLTTKPGRTS